MILLEISKKRKNIYCINVWKIRIYRKHKGIYNVITGRQGVDLEYVGEEV